MMLVVVAFALAYFLLASNWEDQGKPRLLSAMGLPIPMVVNTEPPDIEYSIKFQARPHPSVKPLRPGERALSAMSAKFR
ncbi:hypothetical protein EON65_02350 [archaeon]|nr:MAG: hypothetical protein EON65_02350 [archaeon]